MKSILFAFALVNAVLIWLLWRFSKKLAVAFICSTIVVATVSYQQQQKIKNYLFPVARDVQKKATIPSCRVTTGTLNLKKDQYGLHRTSGTMLPNIKLVASNANRDELIDSNTLLSIKKLDGYIVERMSYGSPYVHKDMYALLVDMQQRFAKKQQEANISNVEIVISSAYRTTSDQERLRKVNPSASKGTSSHSYGASVDIPRQTICRSYPK